MGIGEERTITRDPTDDARGLSHKRTAPEGVPVGNTTFRCRYNPLRVAGGEVIGAVGLPVEAERLSRSAAEARA